MLQIKETCCIAEESQSKMNTAVKFYINWIIMLYTKICVLKFLYANWLCEKTYIANKMPIVNDGIRIYHLTW